MLPKVSVIVLTYNGSDFIKTCLRSVINAKYPKDKLEIIVVDNKSTDNTVQIVKKNFRNVRLLKLDKNYGFAEGNNRGVEIAKGEYVVFLSQDAKVTKTWLVELVKSIYENPEVGAACSVSLYMGNKKKINSVGGWWSLLGMSGSIGDIPYTGEVPRYVFFPSGVSFVMRKDVYRKIGGLDRDYFLYVEDADLGWRTWDAGYKVIICPTSVIYHNKQMYGTRSPKYYFFNTKNRLFTIVKDATSVVILPMLVSSILMHLLQAGIFLYRRKFSHAQETLNGIIWFFANLDLVLRKRDMWKHRTGKAVWMMYGIRDSIYIMSKKTSKHFR